MIVASCELARRGVGGTAALHYGRDFNMIAEAIGQIAEWTVPPGTVGWVAGDGWATFARLH